MCIRDRHSTVPGSSHHRWAACDCQRTTFRKQDRSSIDRALCQTGKPWFNASVRKQHRPDFFRSSRGIKSHRKTNRESTNGTHTAASTSAKPPDVPRNRNGNRLKKTGPRSTLGSLLNSCSKSPSISERRSPTEHASNRRDFDRKRRSSFKHLAREVEIEVRLRSKQAPQHSSHSAASPALSEGLTIIQFAPPTCL